MKLFLDSYYFYSWTRLFTAGVKERIERERKRRKIREVLFFEDLQLPVLSLEKFNSKIVTVLQQRIMDDLNTRFVVRRSAKKIDLLELLERGVSDEHVPLIEYLLLADESGRVDEEAFGGGTEIRVTEEIRRRIAGLNKLSYPQVDPSKYRDYLIARVEKVLKVRVEREPSPKELVMRFEDLIAQAETELCGSDEARRECAVIKRSDSVRSHGEDVRLALAVATYVTKGEPLLVVPKLPADYECFQHMVGYIRQKMGLGDRLIVLRV